MMDCDRYRELVNDARRTRKDIEQMRHNALAKGKNELAHIAEIALDERFPGWDRVRSKRSGPRPVMASFRGKQKYFQTAKEAYEWLMDCFIRDKPEVLRSEDWEKEFVAKGRGVNYFSRDLKSLFHNSPHLADDPNNYKRLGEGWFANLVLSNEQKLDKLHRFGAVAGYVFGKDWNWQLESGKENGTRPITLSDFE
jgi:hypothetical protein